MFRGKIRMHTCKIILFTSLAWFLLDVAVLFYYSDTSSASRNDGGDLHAIPHDPLVSIPGVHAGDEHQTKGSLRSPSDVANHFDAAQSNSLNDDEVGFVLHQFPKVIYF